MEVPQRTPRVLWSYLHFLIAIQLVLGDQNKSPQPVKKSSLPVGWGTWRSPNDQVAVSIKHWCVPKMKYSSLKTSTDHYCRGGRQQFARGLLDVIVRGVISSSTHWCLDSACWLWMKEHQTLVTDVQDTAYVVRQNSMLLGYCLFGHCHPVFNGPFYYSIGPAASGWWET